MPTTPDTTAAPTTPGTTAGATASRSTVPRTTVDGHRPDRTVRAGSSARPAGVPAPLLGGARWAGRHALLAGLDRHLRLDPARPLLVHRTPGPFTFAVVSVAWLRALDPRERERLAERRLAPVERARYEQLTLPKRRSEWLAGRLAVRHAVADQLRGAGPAALADGRAPRDAVVHTVSEGPRAGKPFVAAPVHIGLSHSVDFALAVCGSHPVGVDLEGQPIGPYLARLLAVPEGADASEGMRRVAEMPLPLRWACREAVVKYTGVGTRSALQETRVTDWLPDGTFRWSPGATLLHHSHGADSLPAHGWARQVGAYALAVTWR